MDAVRSLIPSFGSNPTGDTSDREDPTEFSTGAGEPARLMVSSGVVEILAGIGGWMEVCSWVFSATGLTSAAKVWPETFSKATASRVWPIASVFGAAALIASKSFISRMKGESSASLATGKGT